MNRAIRTLGFWSGILSAVFAILWFITFSMQDVLAAVPSWQNIEAYANAFTMKRVLYVYPSLLLPLTYIALTACIHQYAPEDKKVWSLTSLSIGVLYATMASINYNIQAVAVRQSLAAGEFSGLALWIPDNPHSIFGALANSYVYMAFSMLAAGFVFGGGRLERWIRGLLVAQAITIIGQVGWSMFDLSEGLFYATSMVWVVGAPVAFVLLAILFRRQGSNSNLQTT